MRFMDIRYEPMCMETMVSYADTTVDEIKMLEKRVEDAFKGQFPSTSLFRYVGLHARTLECHEMSSYGIALSGFASVSSEEESDKGGSYGVTVISRWPLDDSILGAIMGHR